MVHQWIHRDFELSLCVLFIVLNCSVLTSQNVVPALKWSQRSHEVKGPETAKRTLKLWPQKWGFLLDQLKRGQKKRNKNTQALSCVTKATGALMGIHTSIRGAHTPLPGRAHLHPGLKFSNQAVFAVREMTARNKYLTSSKGIVKN